MAADFFQSNLYNPTAPSEKLLNKKRVRLVTVNNENDELNQTSNKDAKNNSNTIKSEADTKAGEKSNEYPIVNKESMGETSCAENIHQPDNSSCDTPVNQASSQKDSSQNDTTQFNDAGNPCGNMNTHSEKNDENTHESSDRSHRQRFQKLFSVLFTVKWLGYADKDDEIHLIENEISDISVEQKEAKEVTKVSNNNINDKKKKKREHTIAMRKLTKLWTKWLQERKEEKKDEVVDSSANKKKKSNKKNLHQVGRRISRRLGYGCRYIGHGLANMTSIIPEASHVDPMGHVATFSDTEYVKNEYYDPNAPAWDYNKGYCTRRTRVF